MTEQRGGGSGVGWVESHLAALVPFERAAEALRAHARELLGGGVLVTYVAPEGEGAKAALALGDIVLRYGATRLGLAQRFTRPFLAVRPAPGETPCRLARSALGSSSTSLRTPSQNFRKLGDRFARPPSAMSSSRPIASAQSPFRTTGSPMTCCSLSQVPQMESGV